jgi:hypothetical protein
MSRCLQRSAASGTSSPLRAGRSGLACWLQGLAGRVVQGRLRWGSPGLAGPAWPVVGVPLGTFWCTQRDTHDHDHQVRGHRCDVGGVQGGRRLAAGARRRRRARWPRWTASPGVDSGTSGGRSDGGSGLACCWRGQWGRCCPGGCSGAGRTGPPAVDVPLPTPGGRQRDIHDHDHQVRDSAAAAGDCGAHGTCGVAPGRRGAARPPATLTPHDALHAVPACRTRRRPPGRPGGRNGRGPWCSPVGSC